MCVCVVVVVFFVLFFVLFWGFLFSFFVVVVVVVVLMNSVLLNLSRVWCLKRGVTPKIRMLCFVLINNVH